MSLSLTLDKRIKRIVEPGFFQRFGSAELSTAGIANPSPTKTFLWQDPEFHTVMLKPKQLADDWINGPEQLNSIIRLSDFVVNPTDTASGAIGEATFFGNPNNPYIYHSPINLFGAPLFPGSAPSVVGISSPTEFNGIEESSTQPFATYDAAGSLVGSILDGRMIVCTKTRLRANQGIYFRYFHPNPKSGHQYAYIVFLGELAIGIRSNMVEVFQDASPHGDRSGNISGPSWPLIGAGRLFTGPLQAGLYLHPFSLSYPYETGEQDRAVMILPYHRNKVLIQGPLNHFVVETKRPAQPLDNLTDWAITREDTLCVWAISPAPGRFQVQLLQFANGPGTFHLPHLKLDYAPASPPLAAVDGDAFNGTSISGTVADPPGYNEPVNRPYGDCPSVVLNDTEQGRIYGVTLHLTGEATHRFTPFLYGVRFAAAATSVLPSTTEVTVLDRFSGNVSRLVDAELTMGDKPGDGRLHVRVIDTDPYPLSPFYSRANVPLQLLSGATVLFTGISDKIETHEARPDTAMHHEMVIPAVDLWKRLTETFLRDQRDWSGFGHINVVLSIMEQAGIDTSTAETLSLTDPRNIKLGLPFIHEPGGTTTAQTPEQLSKKVKAGWAPGQNETAAQYILRISELFSGWAVGFRLDGTPYYLPEDYFTTSSLTIYKSRAAAIAAEGAGPGALWPVIQSPVEFRTIEPEGNATQVVGGSQHDGRALASGLRVDFPSINTPAAVNYLGAYKFLGVSLPQTFNCDELNAINRVVFNKSRRRVRACSFKTTFIPTLKIGQLVTLQDQGIFKIKGFRARLMHPNDNYCQYEAELNELGYS